MRRLGAVGLLGLVLGFSGCAGAGERLSAQSSMRDRGAGTLTASATRKDQAATTAAASAATSGGLNRYFPGRNSNANANANANTKTNDTLAASRDVTTPPVSSRAPAAPASTATGAIPMPDEAAMETGEVPADLPITLTVHLAPAAGTDAPVASGDESLPPAELAPLAALPVETLPRVIREEPGVIPVSADADADEPPGGAKPAAGTPLSTPPEAATPIAPPLAPPAAAPAAAPAGDQSLPIAPAPPAPSLDPGGRPIPYTAAADAPSTANPIATPPFTEPQFEEYPSGQIVMPTGQAAYADGGCAGVAKKPCCLKQKFCGLFGNLHSFGCPLKKPCCLKQKMCGLFGHCGQPVCASEQSVCASEQSSCPLKKPCCLKQKMCGLFGHCGQPVCASEQSVCASEQSSCPLKKPCCLKQKLCWLFGAGHSFACPLKKPCCLKQKLCGLFGHCHSGGCASECVQPSGQGASPQAAAEPYQGPSDPFAASPNPNRTSLALFPPPYYKAPQDLPPAEVESLTRRAIPASADGVVTTGATAPVPAPAPAPAAAPASASAPPTQAQARLAAYTAPVLPSKRVSLLDQIKNRVRPQNDTPVWPPQK